MTDIASLMRVSGIDAIDARALLRATLAVDDAYLIAHATDEISVRHETQFRALAARLEKEKTVKTVRKAGVAVRHRTKVRC